MFQFVYKGIIFFFFFFLTSCTSGAEGSSLAIWFPSLPPSILPVLPLPQCGIFKQGAPSCCTSISPWGQQGTKPRFPYHRSQQGKTSQVRNETQLVHLATFTDIETSMICIRRVLSKNSCKCDDCLAHLYSCQVSFIYIALVHNYVIS